MATRQSSEDTDGAEARRSGSGDGRRNVLLITVDQMRYDALAHTGNPAVRTPHLDRLAREGVRFTRGHVTNVTCTPSRASMLTGQYPRTHGAWANGVPLPTEAPSVAAHLRDAGGYRTALVGKAHFEPADDPELRFAENQMVASNTHGPYRGFDFTTLATHGPFGGHYGRWMQEHHPQQQAGFLDSTNRGGHPSGGFGGETGAPDVVANPVPEHLYHTTWVADQAVSWLRARRDNEPWFAWVSFPDPHHPWDPPAARRADHPWRERSLPRHYPGSREACRELLQGKPPHWLGYWDGSFKGECSRHDWAPAQLTPDQLREITALVDVEVELIDEAVGQLLTEVERRGWAEHTDVIFTADHGEFQGEFGLLFKGAYHCDALMRVPLLWRPAPAAGIAPDIIDDPVSLIDIAPTICQAAGLAVPHWMQGHVLPPAGTARGWTLTEYDSQNPEVGMHLRTIHADGYTCTVYEPSTVGQPTGLERRLRTYGAMPETTVVYDGSEGELYDLADDPGEFHNRWDDPRYADVRRELVKRLESELPQRRHPWPPAEASV